MRELNKKQRDEGVERNFKKMRYPCMGCRLKNGDDEDNDDHWKLLSEFGVRTRDDFVFKLLPHGAWTRCKACRGEIKGEYGHLGGEHGHRGGANSLSKDERAEAAKLANNAVNEQRIREAAEKALTCQVCERTMPRTQFCPGKNKSLTKPQTCEQCRAEGKLPNEQRSREAAAKPLTCQVCERTMPRTQFRPGKNGKFDLRKPQTCEQCRAEGKLPTAGWKKRRLE